MSFGPPSPYGNYPPVWNRPLLTLTKAENGYQVTVVEPDEEDELDGEGETMCGRYSPPVAKTFVFENAAQSVQVDDGVFVSWRLSQSRSAMWSSGGRATIVMV